MSLAQLEVARAVHTRHKRNTNKFKRWLNETAISCGWKHTGFDITTRDIEDQVHLVAASTDPAKSIPEDIYEALCDAIVGRKECLNSFSEFSFTTEKSIAKHEHFLGILEKARATIPKRERTNENHPWQHDPSQEASERAPALAGPHNDVLRVVVAIPDLGRLRSRASL